MLVAKPFTVTPVQSDPAEKAYERVLDSAGATPPRRDGVDMRIVADVIHRTGGIIDSPLDVGGWPELKSARPPLDSDHDGMPDAWERQRHLDPTNPADGASVDKSADTGGYTNLERYLNESAR